MSVTDGDRERAVALLRTAAADGLIQSTEPRHQPEMVSRIAQALADERERALTDFADLIDRGPTFPLSPSIFSAMARERAEDGQ